jgi:hypothetical protein
MKKSIITGTASVNVLLNDGNSILKEVDFVGKFSERKIVKKAIADLEEVCEVCKAKVVSGSVKEEINTYEMSEETFIANAAIVLDDEQFELELD